MYGAAVTKFLLIFLFLKSEFGGCGAGSGQHAVAVLVMGLWEVAAFLSRGRGISVPLCCSADSVASETF